METTKVIIKMDVNETCILENSWANYSQGIYKGWKITNLLIHSSLISKSEQSIP